MTAERAYVIADLYLKNNLPKHLQYSTMKSNTTNSSYFKIFNDHAEMNFRISDHFNSKEETIMSFIVGKNTKRVSVERFVRNRINDFQKRSLYDILGKGY